MEREDVNIRQAEISDIDKIISFIQEHYYIPDHVFTRKREIFDDWHVHGDKVWFVIAEGKESKKIYGILGYTLYTEDKQTDVAFAMFQTIKSGDPALGIHLITFLTSLYPESLICTCGIVPKTAGIYTFLGYKTGTLKQYYRLSDRKQYKIAQIGNKVISHVAKENGYYFQQLVSIQEVERVLPVQYFERSIPHKDYAYLRRKYFENIGYTYKIFGIFKVTGECVGCFAGREIICNGEKCFKIVDFIGEDSELANCSFAIQKFIEDNQYEYIDFYEIGIDDNVMLQAGFTLNDNKDNIIPQYFEPYVLENITIHYFTSSLERFHAYRSDGGQERPNCICE